MQHCKHKLQNKIAKYGTAMSTWPPLTVRLNGQFASEHALEPTTSTLTARTPTLVPTFGIPLFCFPLLHKKPFHAQIALRQDIHIMIQNKKQ